VKSINLPPLSASQNASWLELLNFAEIVPDNWTLVGGQMVHLLAWERGEKNSRATTDVDTILDIKSDPEALLKVTRQLMAMGFQPVNSTGSKHQISWIKGDAHIDVMIARGAGIRAESRVGAAGATTIATAGGQEALDRSEKILVHLGNRQAVINRPTIVGALIIKSEAALNTSDRNSLRHVQDLALLITMFGASDVESDLPQRTLAKIASGIGAVENRRSTFDLSDELTDSIVRIKTLLGLTS